VKFDDLIGILFLLFFIVGPALKGLFKPSEPLIEVELPEIEPQPEDAAPNQPEPRPAPRQTPAAPVPTAFIADQKDDAAQSPAVSKRETNQTPATAPEKLPDGGRRRLRRLGLETNRRAVLNGMLWHEILSEPVARKRMKQRRRGAKLK